MQPASPYPLTQRLAHVLAARLAPGADLDQQALAAVSRALLDAQRRLKKAKPATL